MADVLPDVYLRFLGEGDKAKFEGGCRDAMHPGKDGWISVKSFDFGFGWKDGSAEIQRLYGKIAQGKATEPEKKKHQELVAAQQAKPGKSSEEEHTLKPDPFTFDKLPDFASDDLMGLVRNPPPEKEELRVVLEACRPLAYESQTKVAFMTLTFNKVRVTKCAVQVSSDPTPSEHVEFTFEKVKLETLWTANTDAEYLGKPWAAEQDFGSQAKEEQNQ